MQAGFLQLLGTAQGFVLSHGGISPARGISSAALGCPWSMGKHVLVSELWLGALVLVLNIFPVFN